MTYLWINPVTDCMYEREVLNAFLQKHGYQRFETNTDWCSIVKEKYAEAVRQSSNTVIDMRCPKAAELLKELEIGRDVTFPDIHPILIHCGIESSERIDLKDVDKIITTPCQALADMGNSLGLNRTRFVPWNRFLETLGSAPKSLPIEKSPIPPGFFSDLHMKTESLTGENEIKQYFASIVPDEAQLVEILFCKDGCHNGDGVRDFIKP